MCYYPPICLLSDKAMAPLSSNLVWKIPWMEEPGRLQSMGSLRVRYNWATSLSCIGEENGNPLQCSCLENPRDGGAWWATIYGVAESDTEVTEVTLQQFFASGGHRIGVSVWASVLPMNIQDQFPLGWTSWISLQSKELSRVFNTTAQSINSSVFSFLYSPTFISIHDYWKNHSFD